MSPAPVIHFPKPCPHHHLPMHWNVTHPIEPGWECPKCTAVCPIHGTPLHAKPKGAYCRPCRIAKIVAEYTNTKRHGAPKDPGVAIVLRAVL